MVNDEEESSGKGMHSSDHWPQTNSTVALMFGCASVLTSWRADCASSCSALAYPESVATHFLSWKRISRDSLTHSASCPEGWALSLPLLEGCLCLILRCKERHQTCICDWLYCSCRGCHMASWSRGCRTYCRGQQPSLLWGPTVRWGSIESSSLSVSVLSWL